MNAMPCRAKNHMRVWVIVDVVMGLVKDSITNQTFTRTAVTDMGTIVRSEARRRRNRSSVSSRLTRAYRAVSAVTAPSPQVARTAMTAKLAIIVQMVCVAHDIMIPQSLVRLACFLDLCPGVLERHYAVKDGFLPCRINGIREEISQAFELVALATLRAHERGLKLGVVEYC